MLPERPVSIASYLLKEAVDDTGHTCDIHLSPCKKLGEMKVKTLITAV